jgi:hypothetical protein
VKGDQNPCTRDVKGHAFDTCCFGLKFRQHFINGCPRGKWGRSGVNC